METAVNFHSAASFFKRKFLKNLKLKNMPKARLQATHFIEQTVGVYTGDTYNSQPFGIDFINTLLACKVANVTKTVAIFKIKLKNQPHS